MVRYAGRADYKVLKTLDIHIREEELAKAIDGGRFLKGCFELMKMKE